MTIRPETIEMLELILCIAIVVGVPVILALRWITKKLNDDWDRRYDLK